MMYKTFKEDTILLYKDTVKLEETTGIIVGKGMNESAAGDLDLFPSHPYSSLRGLFRLGCTVSQGVCMTTTGMQEEFAAQ